MEDSKTEKPGIWSASFAFVAVRRSTVGDEVVAVTPVRLNGPACWHALRERSSQPAGFTHPQRARRPEMMSMKADGLRNECGAYVAQADFVRTAVGKATRRGTGEVHSKPACHADRPGRAGVANADRESKLGRMPVPWTCDLDRTSRSCRVFCSLQCMACVHWSHGMSNV